MLFSSLRSSLRASQQQRRSVEIVAPPPDTSSSVAEQCLRDELAACEADWAQEREALLAQLEAKDRRLWELVHQDHPSRLSKRTPTQWLGDVPVDDTPPPTEGDGGNPFRQAVTTAWREILMVAGTSTFWSCGFYVATTWVPTYVSSPDLVRPDPSLPPVSEGSA